MRFAKAMERTFQTEEQLRTFASEFGLRLEPGDVVGLSGPLGAGKTTFVQSVVSARLGHDPTSSPTFTFWHRYAGSPPIDHLDLYRVEYPQDLRELGLEEVFDGTSVVLVEWWSNAPELLPERRYEIELEGAGDQPRRMRMRRPG